MNKLIKKQLQNLKSVKVNFDDNTTKIIIPKTLEIIPDALIKGDIYLIKLSDLALSPSSNSTLAANWNAGKVPTHRFYKVELIDVMKDMYKFNGIAVEDGVDLYSENWFGWFPGDYFSVIEKL